MNIYNIYFQLFMTIFCSVQRWGTVEAFSVPTVTTRKISVALKATPVSNNNWDLNRLAPLQRIEGSSRKTWDFDDMSREVVQVVIKSDGRPMYAEVQLWMGPDYTPYSLKVYSEDGAAFPCHILVGTRNKSAQIEIRNTGPYEYPLSATCAYAEAPLSEIRSEIPKTNKGRYVEGGGSIYSVPFGSEARQIQCLLDTEKRQLKATVELLNGPNNNKQTYEVYTSSGLLNSLYVVFTTTPGTGNTIRIKNVSTHEFPCNAYVSAV